MSDIDNTTSDMFESNVQQNMLVSREAIIAWCAGIVDGEGCISIHKRKPGSKSQPAALSYSYRVDLKVKMTHKPAIELLHSTIGLGKMYSEQPGKLNKKVAWLWLVYGKEAIIALELLLPFLFIKRDEALLAIKYFKSPLSSRIGNGIVPIKSQIFRDECYRQMQNLKKFEWK